MELEHVNRLPMPTYRYLKTNDSALPFRMPARMGRAVFSDPSLLTEGAELPETFSGASERWLEAAAAGERLTIRVPAGEEKMLAAEIVMDEAHPDYAGTFRICLGKGAKLRLLWKISGGEEEGAAALACSYELEEGAELHVSSVERGMRKKILCMQRVTETGAAAKAVFAGAQLGGETVIIHSRSRLAGRGSFLGEYGVYAAGDTQALDYFYHADHLGEETESDIEVKGALAGRSKKVFRSTIDFKRGCSGAVGSEGDYVIQLDPATKNISLPLLLCTEDNVSGNHASSAGQIDEGTVYYLMSRGLTKEEARRIVVESLIRPLIDRMDESLREETLAAVREKLDEHGE